MISTPASKPHYPKCRAEERSPTLAPAEAPPIHVLHIVYVGNAEAAEAAGAAAPERQQQEVEAADEAFDEDEAFEEDDAIEDEEEEEEEEEEDGVMTPPIPESDENPVRLHASQQANSWRSEVA